MLDEQSHLRIFNDCTQTKQEFVDYFCTNLVR